MSSAEDLSRVEWIGVRNYVADVLDSGPTTSQDKEYAENLIHAGVIDIEAVIARIEKM